MNESQTSYAWGEDWYAASPGHYIGSPTASEIVSKVQHPYRKRRRFGVQCTGAAMWSRAVAGSMHMCTCRKRLGINGGAGQLYAIFATGGHKRPSILYQDSKTLGDLPLSNCPSIHLCSWFMPAAVSGLAPITESQHVRCSRSLRSLRPPMYTPYPKTQLTMRPAQQPYHLPKAAHSVLSMSLVAMVCFIALQFASMLTFQTTRPTIKAWQLHLLVADRIHM